MIGRPADVEAFLARLVRLDPVALVRLRVGATQTTLWGRVPWDVLVSRTLVGLSSADGEPPDGEPPDGELSDGDFVVRASDWLTAPATSDVRTLTRRDAGWRTALPPLRREVLEEVPGDELRGLGVAAADTLRATEAGGVGGRAVGARAVRDALLDHIAIVVSAGPRRVEVPQRLVQAVVRMGFAAADEPVRVLAAGQWIGLAAAYGTAWWRPSTGLGLTPAKRTASHRG
ncbi:MAG TPA: hypothetical protein VFR11_12020 [Micromonosporaceae bacterium]|jgi:hypothetical protein|nr:hypothetical protein [Micromonosporaceae bacterium]